VVAFADSFRCRPAPGVAPTYHGAAVTHRTSIGSCITRTGHHHGNTHYRVTTVTNARWASHTRRAKALARRPNGDPEF
jgi:hypothetical protein